LAFAIMNVCFRAQKRHSGEGNYRSGDGSKRPLAVEDGVPKGNRNHPTKTNYNGDNSSPPPEKGSLARPGSQRSHLEVTVRMRRITAAAWLQGAVICNLFFSSRSPLRALTPPQ
jgi:hypothetical protein